MLLEPRISPIAKEGACENGGKKLRQSSSPRKVPSMLGACSYFTVSYPARYARPQASTGRGPLTSDKRVIISESQPSNVPGTPPEVVSLALFAKFRAYVVISLGKVNTSSEEDINSRYPKCPTTMSIKERSDITDGAAGFFSTEMNKLIKPTSG